MKRCSRGFSLIELMIVIAIIGILAAIAVPSYQTYVLKSKMGELLSAASAAQLAAAEFVQSSGEADCTDMPIVVEGLGPNDGGLFAYPTSDLVASVEIATNCNVTVVGAGGVWGTFGTPSVISTATIDDGAISYSCRSSEGTTFAPSTCPPLVSS